MNTACTGFKHPRGDDGGDGIGGIVKAVDEIERHRRYNNEACHERGGVDHMSVAETRGHACGAFPDLLGRGAGKKR